jgi:NADPH-dependent glutamate synthase beta subunit-like oxidoreductase
MDQKAWREIEDRCIQEEAPPCTARCPIHVDVRAFLREVTAGQWDRARRTLTAAMPVIILVRRYVDEGKQGKQSP